MSNCFYSYFKEDPEKEENNRYKRDLEKQNNRELIPFKDYSVRTILDVKEEDKEEFKEYIKSLRIKDEISTEDLISILFPLDPDINNVWYSPLYKSYIRGYNIIDKDPTEEDIKSYNEFREILKSVKMEEK